MTKDNQSYKNLCLSELRLAHSKFNKFYLNFQNLKIKNVQMEREKIYLILSYVCALIRNSYII